MPKNLMNEAERFLLDQWEQARLLEESMEEVRTKYKEVFERTIVAVAEDHPELNASVAYPTQFWGSGYIGFGRKTWPGGETRWPSGLWLENLRLEKLAAEDSGPPYGHLWFSDKSKTGLDLDRARTMVSAAAKTLLSPQELKGTQTGDSKGVLLYLSAPSKRELLTTLADGDGQKFVALLVACFDVMARFIPVLDQIFNECVSRD